MTEVTLVKKPGLSFSMDLLWDLLINPNGQVPLNPKKRKKKKMMKKMKINKRLTRKKLRELKAII